MKPCKECMDVLHSMFYNVGHFLNLQGFFCGCISETLKEFGTEREAEASLSQLTLLPCVIYKLSCFSVSMWMYDFSPSSPFEPRKNWKTSQNWWNMHMLSWFRVFRAGARGSNRFWSRWWFILTATSFAMCWEGVSGFDHFVIFQL